MATPHFRTNAWSGFSDSVLRLIAKGEIAELFCQFRKTIDQFVVLNQNLSGGIAHHRNTLHVQPQAARASRFIKPLSWRARSPAERVVFGGWLCTSSDRFSYDHIVHRLQSPVAMGPVLIFAYSLTANADDVILRQKVHLIRIERNPREP